jgi:hypothetical protein
VERDEEGYTWIVSHCRGCQLQLLAWFAERDEVYGIHCTCRVERQEEPFNSQNDNRSQAIALSSAYDSKSKHPRVRQGVDEFGS